MGYVVGAYKIELNPPCSSMSIKVNTNRHQGSLIVGVYRWLYLVDQVTSTKLLVPFKPLLSHPANQICAVIHRVGCQMAVPHKRIGERFVRFAKCFIQRAFEPLYVGEIPTLDEWLEHHSYSGSRKEQLRILFDQFGCGGFTAKTVEVKSFLKDEEYDEPKNPRSINSSSDTTKSILGALFHAIDKKTFSTKWFVKGTNPRDWPELMSELFGSNPVVGTDFKSFEAHHSGIYADIIYYWAMHMLRGVHRLPGMKMLRLLIRRMMLGINNMKFKTIFVRLSQRLMSGNLWTSSANGVLNLLLNAFMAAITVNPGYDDVALVDWAIHDFKGLCEGDDGIFVDYHISPHLPNRLGLKLKWDRASSFDQIGFCQIYCDPIQMVSIKSPLSVLRKFDILPKEYKDSGKMKCLAYLRAKAICYAVSFGSSPIVGVLAHTVLRLTRSIDPSVARAALGNYHAGWLDLGVREKVWSKAPTISESSRIIVARRWRIPIDEQLRMERDISATIELGHIKLDLSAYIDRNTLFHTRYLVEVGQPQPMFHDPFPPVVSAYFKGEHPSFRFDPRALRVSRGFLSGPNRPAHDVQVRPQRDTAV